MNFINNSEILHDILIGLISSFLASWFTYLFLKYWQKVIDKRKYLLLQGFYHGKTLIDPTHPVDIGNPTSHATITYLKDNELTIELTDHPYSGHNKWVGNITMQSEIIGTIVWHYEKHENQTLETSKHLFGLKQLVKRKIESELFVYLIDAHFLDGQGNNLKEVLKKVK